MASNNKTQDVGDAQEQARDAGPTVFAHPSSESLPRSSISTA